MTLTKALLLTPFLLLTARAETVVEPKIDGVELFKNGLTVVRASFPAPEPGIYVWNEAPRAVHGTFWIESDVPVEARGKLKNVRAIEDKESATGDLQKDLAGKDVKITLKSGRMIGGTVWTLPDPEPVNVMPAQNIPQRFNHIIGFNPGLQLQEGNLTNYLALDDSSGQRILIAKSEIIHVESKDGFAPLSRWETKPVLYFTVGGESSADRIIQISWLVEGMTWAPSYLVDLGEDGKLTIEQNAMIRNELIDLKGTDIGLISGFPHISFGSVDSPIWASTALSSFFSQLNNPNSRPNLSISNNIVTQAQIWTNGDNGYGGNLNNNPEETGGTSDDIHIESIGKRDLTVGETLSLQVARKPAEYERVVEWIVPDHRDKWGRYQHRDDDKTPWDAISFKNPFDFPMTTAPAMVRDDGHFRGQTTSTWVNPGKATTLRVTKALSIATQYHEIEEEGEREKVWIGGNDYRRTTVKGTFKLNNTRGTDVRMKVTTEFSGELIESDGEPEKSLRTEGVTSVNPSRELIWSIDLTPGEEKEVSFRYSVLVRD